MKRVIPFSRARYFFFAFSVLLVLIGVTGYVINHGFNLGVDFKAGIAIQFQIAPASFTVQYNGPDKAEISIPAGEEALTSAGNIIITITNASSGTRQAYPFNYSSFASVRDLTSAIAKVSGVTVTPVGNLDAIPTDLIPLTRPQNIAGKPAYVNLSPGAGRGVTTNLADMRATLASLGQVELQAVGAPANQEFMARLEAKSDDPTFQTTTETSLTSLLESKYGVGQVILKSTNFIGRRVAQSLGTQAIWLIIVAVLLIMVYMMFRFRPAIYAVAAVIAIMHDALVMLSFDAVFRVEIDAATIAAILTILGYSINDTIVIFDRVRENKKLMRGTGLQTLLDTSVTQTLSRTFITSGATLLTVIALYALTSGSLKNFSLNMIVGIVEGTYSTFIASFIVLEWTNFSDKRKKKRELDRFGIGGHEEAVAVRQATLAKQLSAPAAMKEIELPDEVEPEKVPGAFATESEREAGESASPDGAPAGEAESPGQPAAQPAGQPGAPPSAQPKVVAFPGSHGSRKHKKHRRRHH